MVSVLISRVAERMLTLEDEIADAMDAGVFEHAPVLESDPVLRAETRASNRANLRRFLTLAQNIDDPKPPDVPPEALDVVRTLVRRGIDLEAIFQGYRAGQQVAWQRFLESAVVATDGADLPAVLERSTALLFKYVDDTLARVLAEAQHEREEILSGAHAARVSTARLILDDAPIDDATASRRLGYELSRHHTCVVLWAEPPEVAQGALESAALLMSRAVDARRPFLMTAGTSTLWAWIGGTSTPSATALRGALDQAPPQIRAAIGPTLPGVHGFRRSHEGATAVQRLLIRQQGGDRLTTYAELEVTALASGDEQRAAEFVSATLGRLAADTATAARLRETLRVYLDVADNAPAAAARLHLHRNTVLQRVAKATDMLGYDVGDRRLALTLALELAHRLGSRMLTVP